MVVRQLREKLEQAKGEQAKLNRSIEQTSTDIQQGKKSLKRHEEAREIIKTVGLETQQQLQYHISDITSLALNAVFSDPYKLLVEFVQRRNKTECDLLFKRGETTVEPLSGSGGGAVDVASFALRVASWSMQEGNSENVIILDEPLHWLSTDLQDYASQMIKELSEKLGLQFIIVTHEETLSEYADKIFQVTMKAGKSKVKEV